MEHGLLKKVNFYFIFSEKLIFRQPRPQGFSLKTWVGRESSIHLNSQPYHSDSDALV